MRHKKLWAFIVVVVLMAIPLAKVAAAASMTCEGECNAAFSAAVDETNQNFLACSEVAGAILCSGFLVILAGQMAAWATCLAGCGGPFIMSGVRRDYSVVT
jgi:hypothetical protein